MNEQERFNLYVSIMLLIVLALVIFNAWRLDGEIEYLHERIGAIDGRPVARILRARDDAAAEAAAKGAT